MEALNTSYNIEEHSKVKLSIYKEYLKAYLAIMSVQIWYKQINVIDPFAGVGISNNGQDGSAIIARNIIQGMKTDKQIRLFLNELDKNNFQQLKTNIGEHDFITFCNEDADKFLFVKEELDKLGYDKYVMSEVTFVPDNYIALDEETSEKVISLIEALEDMKSRIPSETHPEQEYYPVGSCDRRGTDQSGIHSSRTGRRRRPCFRREEIVSVNRQRQKTGSARGQNLFL